MKKITALSVLLFLPIAAFAQNSIEGVWTASQNPGIFDGSQVRDLSWGSVTLPDAFDLVIDCMRGVHTPSQIPYQNNHTPSALRRGWLICTAIRP